MSLDADLQQRAREFAIDAHKHQYYGEQPYSVHLDAVAKYVEPYGEVAIAIAYLHDVVEDTHVTLQQLEQSFGPFIAQCVGILTDEPGASRAERKSKTYLKMSKVSGERSLALTVKVADRLANIEACFAKKNNEKLAMYLNEQPAFKSSIYRSNLCDDLWQKLESLI